MIFIFILIFLFSLKCIVDDKNTKLATVLLVMFMMVQMVFSVGNPDYGNYLIRYNNIGIGEASFDILNAGSFILMYLFNLFNFSYTSYLLFVAISIFSIIISLTNKISKSSLLCILLYYIFSFMIDLVQINHFISMVLLTTSLFSLYNYEYKKSYLLFFISVSFHITSLFFLPFFILHKFKKKSLLILTFSLLMLLVLIIQTGFLEKVLFEYLSSFDLQSLKKYFISKPILGLIPVVFLQCTNFLIIRHIYYKTRSCNKHTMYEFVYKLNIYVLCAIPFCMIHLVFERCFRVIILFNIIVFVNYIYSFCCKKRLSYVLYFIFYQFLFCFWYIFFSYYETIVKVIF